MDIKISKVRLLDGRTVDIAIEGDRISDLCGDVPGNADIEIDGSKFIAMPGLVNCHTHAAMSLFRGYGDDMPLDKWLQERIWPAEAKLTADDIYWGAKFACLEMIMSGTTTFSDMYFHSERTAQAASDAGMRALINEGYIDLGDPDKREVGKKETLESLEKIKAIGDPQVQPALGPHAPYTVSKEGWEFMCGLAKEQDLLVHFHLGETAQNIEDVKGQSGMKPVEFLNSVGVFEDRCTAAHGVHFDDEEIKLLAQKGVNIIHNPESNMKLGVGSKLRYRELKAAGVNICLGTDGSASNNGLDMFTSMKFAALLSKMDGYPEAMPALEAVELATVNGAKALGIDAGVLEIGKLADIILLDKASLCFHPGFDHISDVVYAADGSCVDTVIIGGKIVMQGRHVDWAEECISKMTECSQKFRS